VGPSARPVHPSGGATTGSVATLGLAAVLLALWTLAALAASLLGERWLAAAAALDPARPGSIVDHFATGEVLLALLVTLSSPRTWFLALTPAALLLGEAGELHLRVASLFAMAGDRPGTLFLAKALAASLIGAVAAWPLALPRHRFRCVDDRQRRRLLLQLVLGGSAAAVLDLAAHRVGGATATWLARAEEIVELALYSTLAWRLIEAGATNAIRTNLGLKCATR
jgi:hypothetical protein